MLKLWDIIEVELFVKRLKIYWIKPVKIVSVVNVMAMCSIIYTNDLEYSDVNFQPNNIYVKIDLLLFYFKLLSTMLSKDTC